LRTVAKRIALRHSHRTGVYDHSDANDQSFARKLIFIPGLDRQVVHGEARAITKLCARERPHENIVVVLNHGELPNTPYYFFDMELCALNLDDYIHRETPPNPSESLPFFIKDAPGSLKAQQIWNIMTQIASGVKHIHSHGAVHRDLKPANSIFLKIIANVVLYSRNSSTWKLADFGISTEGTTSHAVTTKESRGSAGYRAPELLEDDKAVYTNKVDIWSMGCILYELAVGRKAFWNDYAVYAYCAAGKEFGGVLDEKFDDEISKSRLEKTILSLLQIEPSSRPSASDLLKEFICDSQPPHDRLQYVKVDNGEGSGTSHVLELDGSQSIAMAPLAENGHFGGLEAMPEVKEYVDAREKDRETTSHQGTSKGRIRASLAKVVENKDVNAWDEQTKTWELKKAAERGDVDMIKVLKEASGDVSTRRGEGATPMHTAALNGHVDAIRALAEVGGDVSAKDNGGLTPMHCAALNGDVRVIRVLKEAGGDISEVDNNGWTPMHSAAVNGHVDAIRALADEGGDVSAKENGGLTPMHCAARNGHVRVIRVLKEAGGNVSAKNKNGLTPMHAAAVNAQVAAIRALKEAGGDISEVDNNGWTPMHSAAVNGQVDAIRALADEGGDVSAKENGGLTPMHCAAHNGHVRVIRVLKDAGSNVSAKNKNGWTPMHCAAQNGHVNVIRALKEAGGNVSAKNKNGWTPMHYAAQNGHVNVIRALKEAGGDVRAKTYEDGCHDE
jgi:ankyrin repeat protein